MLGTRVGVARGEAAFPPQGRFLTVDGVRLHYVDDGPRPAPLVVLLHGNPGLLDDFDPSRTALLRAGYRVVALDRPGHGYSSRPKPVMTLEQEAVLLRHFLGRIGAADPVLVGHSWGSTLALVYSLAYPREVAGLVLIGAVAYPYHEGFGIAFELLRTPIIGWLLRETIVLPIGRMAAAEGLREAYWPAAAPAPQAALARALMTRPDDVLASAWDRVLLRRSVRKYQGAWGRIRLPVVELQGTGDRVSRDAPRLARQIPDATLVWVPACGHEVPVTAPWALVAAVRRIEDDVGSGRRASGRVQ